MTSLLLLSAVPPGLWLMLGGVLLPVLGRRARAVTLLALPLFVLGMVWLAPDGGGPNIPFLDYLLVPVRADALGRLFATIFAIMAFGGGIYALNRDSRTELSAAMIYAGGAIGVAMAGDLVTVFVFWEIMAAASMMVLWSAGTGRCYRAGFRYIVIHLFGGVVLMSGIAAYVAETGSIDFVNMTFALETGNPAPWLILAGFLLNAGAPPLSAWLPDAYPEASVSGTVTLSAFTTKTAVYVLLRGFPGAEILIWIGLYMAFYGIIYALLENDMRRILAYSIVNQVGFMVTGIGIGTEMALNGAAAHAFAHIIYKGLLLMSAGSVLHMTGKRKCSDLGGLFRSMPITTTCGIIGALSISAFPLTSGFISKSMIAQGAADASLAWVWFLLTAASAGVFLHAGIKFPWFVFFQKDSGLRPPDPPLNMRIAMILFAVLCIAIGVYPAALYALLPFPVDFVPYTGGHVVGILQLLMFAGLAFFLLLPQMRRTPTITLDVDWFWRRFGRAVAREFTIRGIKARGHVAEITHRRVERFIARIARHHGPQGLLARSWPTGSTVLWVALLLGVYLVFYYV